MPNYGLYQLSNSREVPRFVGSAVPELTQASQIMQGRYDTSLQYEDAIDQGIQQATALGQDTKHLMDLKAKYRERLGERAKRGDYENMVRETSKDARNFINEYKPIAQNQALVQEYRKRLDEQVQKGEVTPERAAQMLDYSMKSYKGLQKDPTTGQFVNQFQGRQMVKDLNMAEWVDKQLIGLHPTTTGSTIQKDVNGYYRLEGDKRVRLDYEKEIKPILDAAKKTDPMYKAWVDQETLLSSYQAKYVPEQALKESPLYPQLQQLANQQGITLNEAYQAFLAQRKYGEIENTLAQMGNKYRRNDREWESKELGETAATKRINDKKFADAENPFGVDIILPMPGTQFASPVKLDKGIEQRTTIANKIADENQQFMSHVRAQQNQKGETIYFDTRTGQEVTTDVARNKLAEEQARASVAELENRKKEAWTQANGGRPYNPNPALMVKAKQAAQDRVNELMSNRQGQEMTMEEKRREGQLAYDAVMRTDPLYPQYKKILEADGQAGTTTATGYRFPSKDANDAATGIFKNFALNLDKDKLNAGVIGIQKVDGTPFEPEDYAKVKSDAEFATWILDPSEGNKLKFIYNVGKVTTNTKGEVVGEKMLVKTDALPGAEQLLVKTGQLEPLRILFGDRIGALESSDRKTTTFEPVKGYTVEVERLNKSEIDNKKYGAATAPYRVTYTSPNGKKDSYPAPDQEAVIEAIMSSLKK